MTQHWFTSDWHFGHKNILNYCGTFRPFADVTEMNEGLVRIWNEHIAPDDTVTFIGDAVMGNLDEGLRYIGRLNGTIRLVCGNHDAPAPMHHKTKGRPDKQAEWTQKYIDAGFAEVITGHITEDIGGVAAVVCHFPYEGDHTEDTRYEEHRPFDDGVTPIVHGHVHDAWVYRGRQMNVGFDAWGRPVREEEVIEFVRRFK